MVPCVRWEEDLVTFQNVRNVLPYISCHVAPLTMPFKHIQSYSVKTPSKYNYHQY